MVRFSKTWWFRFFHPRKNPHDEAAESSKECLAGLFGSFEIQLQDMLFLELRNF